MELLELRRLEEGPRRAGLQISEAGVPAGLVSLKGCFYER